MIIVIIYFFDKSLLYSRSIIIIDLFLTFLFIGGFRPFYRLFLEFVDREVQRNNSVNRVAIIGVGEIGINVLRFLKIK